MIAAEDETEAEVTWDDQQMINAFGRLSARKSQVAQERKTVSDDLERLTEAEEELMLAVEDGDKVLFKVGESFLHLTSDQVNERIEKRQGEINADVEKMDAEVADIDKTLAGLKVKLYGKFGSSINLEDSQVKNQI